MRNTIWKTAEAEAWCRGFQYWEYVEIICQHMNIKPLSIEMYRALCDCFDEELERDIGCQQTDGELT